jgi:hypothetical protein
MVPAPMRLHPCACKSTLASAGQSPRTATAILNITEKMEARTGIEPMYTVLQTAA